MTESDIRNLDIWDKLFIYNHFIGVRLYFKHTSIPSIHIPTFEQFISDDNIEITDNGEDWEEKGVYAQRIRTDYTGIYDWAWKFETEVKALVMKVTYPKRVFTMKPIR